MYRLDRRPAACQLGPDLRNSALNCCRLRLISPKTTGTTATGAGVSRSKYARPFPCCDRLGPAIALEPASELEIERIARPRRGPCVGRRTEPRLPSRTPTTSGRVVRASGKQPATRRLVAGAPTPPLDSCGSIAGHVDGSASRGMWYATTNTGYVVFCLREYHSMRLPWAKRRVEARFTGYYTDSGGYIRGPDPRYSGRFYISHNYIVGDQNCGRFFLSEPPVAGLRYVYDTHKPGGPFWDTT